MSARAVRWALAGLVGLACTTYADHAQRVRLALLGRDARTLPVCIGPPLEHTAEGDTERHLYFWKMTEPEVSGRSPIDPMGALEPRTAREELDPERAKFSYCKLTFVLRDRRIQDIEAEGRNADGLNSDARCLAALERCLPEPVAN